MVSQTRTALQAKYPEAEAMLTGLLKTEEGQTQDVGTIAILIQNAGEL